MRVSSMRRGSALLIVLGMMSFIVVSAVAFATYMRYARLPSSYLRRTSASRMLAKAALAETIEVIDTAIGNNPYPGVGTVNQRLPRMAGVAKNYNVWRDRVFIGYENEGDYPLPGETVATLNMEALAYIPPPFINEVRYWSRRSMGGRWHKLSFDAGRYAFTAVDVSDCFDINRLAAGVARDSSDLGRVTLAHAFRNPNNTSAPVAGNQWDNFIRSYLTATVPLVSVADLNLALANNGPVDSPFVSYLDQATNAKFVQNTSGPQAEFVKNMAFITESYFPTTNLTNGIDISDPANQPFDGFNMARTNPTDRNADTLERVLNSGSNDFLDKFLNPMEAVQLYDYLDGNSIPLSLALPTYERTPMITGVLCEANGVQLQVSETGSTTSLQLATNPNQQTQKVKLTAYALSMSGDLAIEPSFVFPFADDRGETPSFKAQAAVTVTFVPIGTQSRLRVAANAARPFVFTKDAWSTSQQAAQVSAASGEPMPVVVTALSQMQPISIRTIEDEKNAVIGLNGPLTFNLNNLEFALPASDVFPIDSLPSWARTSTLPPAKATFLKCEHLDENDAPYNGAAPTFLSALRVANTDLSGVVTPQNGTEYVPVIQIWVRVLDSSGKVVDLVPACGDDDEQPWGDLGGIASSARARPLLRFFPEGEKATACSLTANAEEMLTKFENPVTVELKYKAFLADDPRFNYAPENLIALEQVSGDLKDAWYSAQRSAGREGDIFMMSSDAGYLQSPYELAALSVISGSLKAGEGGGESIYDGSGFNGQLRTSFENTPANNAMWRTYSQYSHNNRSGDIARLGITSGVKGFRINPYTSDPTVMYAAIGNAPLGWYEASTNTQVRGASDFTEVTLSDGRTKRKAIKIDSALTYCDDDQARAKFKDLSNDIIAKMKASAGTTRTWDQVFDQDLNWNEDDQIGSVDFSSALPLFSADKKFLYGFWRECFANTQQLFLVFIRAEPMMMGGGGLGQTPPQLGARAVALVWRDPTPTTADVQGQPRPHKTRVLFYRQLD